MEVYGTRAKWKRVSHLKRNFLYTLLIMFIVANGSPLLAQSWTRLDSGLTSNSVTSFAAIDTNLFAGTTDQGVFLSTNNGISWTRIDSGLTTLNVRVLFIDGGTFLQAPMTAFFSHEQRGKLDCRQRGDDTSGCSSFCRLS